MKTKKVLLKQYFVEPGALFCPFNHDKAKSRLICSFFSYAAILLKSYVFSGPKNFTPKDGNKVQVTARNKRQIYFSLQLV